MPSYFWEFIPYNDDPEEAISDVFIDQIKAERTNLLSAATGADRKESLRKLKRAYDEHFGAGSEERNVISLFLYSGPIYSQWNTRWLAEGRSISWPPSRRRHRFPFPFMCDWCFHELSEEPSLHRCSILYTGDGYLDTKERLNKLIGYLDERRVRNTAVFQVMHHGAKTNWHQGTAVAIAPLFSVFSSDPERKKWKHPHASVLPDFCPYGIRQIDKKTDFTSSGYLIKANPDYATARTTIGKLMEVLGSEIATQKNSMANRVTVFYSWQSDTPSNVNRNFIEKALKEALKRLRSDAELDSPLRDSVVELDKDTKGVAGSPPIAQTILAKIEQCAVFVADLTFVGQSKADVHSSIEKQRLFPNPNVLIEYGYALRCHTHAKIIGVVNTAFGEPNSETLPFDLGHLRWPITYRLSENSDLDKTDQFEKLTTTLVDALRAILSQHLEKEETTAFFVPRKSTANPAIFYRDMEELIPEAGVKTAKNTYCVPEGAKAYLRLYPTKSVPQLRHKLEAKEKANQGKLRPLGEVSGFNTIRNALGAIASCRKAVASSSFFAAT